MRTCFFLLMISLCCMGCGLSAKTQKSIYHVTAAQGLHADCPVVITDIPVWAQSAVVYDGDREVVSQLDAPLRELAFVDNIQGGRDYRIVWSSKPASRSYPPRVHAQMWLKNPDKTLTAADTVASDRNDMYHKLHHHGPAFESAFAAYRIYFDDKQTVDAYGKKQLRLELAETNWYPTEEQLGQEYGYDNLRVFGSVGVGTLKGWDGEKGKTTHITDYRRREARILAKGPVRTVVEMRVEGWRYCGREIDMTSRYILYAGHSDFEVENRIEGDFHGLVFATGIVRMIENKVVKDQEVITAYGRDYPENDTLKWERESVALAVAVPRGQIVSQIDDKSSYLFQLTPDAAGRIDYSAGMLWRRSGWLEDRGEDEFLLDEINTLRQARRKVIVSRLR